MLGFYLALLKELLLSPAQLVAWVHDDDHGHAQPFVVTLFATVVTSVVSVALAASQPPPGTELGMAGALIVIVFVFLTMLGSLYLGGLIYLIGAWIFGGRDATFSQGVRLGAGVLWLSAVLSVPASLFAARNFTFAMVLLSLALLYVLFLTGKGLIEAMGAHPTPVWIVGALLALPTLAFPVGVPLVAEQNRIAQEQRAAERHAQREAEVQRKVREAESSSYDPAARAAEMARADERAEAQRERARAEKAEAEARLRERMEQAVAAKGGDYLEVRIRSIPPNAQVATKDGREQFGATPTTAKFHKTRFPVVLTLTAPSGKQVDYEVSSLQGSVTVMIPE